MYAVAERASFTNLVSRHEETRECEVPRICAVRGAASSSVNRSISDTKGVAEFY